MKYESRELDLGGALLLFTRFHGDANDSELDEWLTQHRQWMRKVALREPAAVLLLFDLRHAPLINAHQRQRLSSWVSEYDALGSRAALAFAAVVPSAAMRGVLTAMFWINPLDHPSTTCASVNEGLEFLYAHSEQRGVRVPEEQRRSCQRLCEAERKP